MVKLVNPPFSPSDQDRRLLKLWLGGLGSGPGRFADISAIKAEGRRRLGTPVGEPKS
ncbi:MAG TPA: hypothetical protein VG407_18100 [Caulobacteraceae bacterium]|nr:hypothetical protein [Caulobacteraceae bacterium]